jgi:hypothetical protein
MVPGLPAPVLLAALLAAPAAPASPSGIDVAVTAAAPIDAQHLADVLRAYLDEYGVRVESAPAPAPGDLRRQLADARQLGERVRAMAVVRVQNGEGTGGRGTVEIDIVDLATEKVLIAEVPRPQRDEDLYRALALKIQASLRATLSEAPEKIEPGSGLARLVSTPAAATQSGPARGDETPGRLALETGYLLFVFPLSGVGLQGLSLGGSFAVRRWLDVTLSTGLLGTARGEGGGVTAAGTVVPLMASARLRLRGDRLEAMLGPAVELTYVGVTPASPTTAVRVTRYVMPSVGADAEARLRVGASAWIYGRITALGILLGERYLVQGQNVLDTSRLQASASVGLGIALF